MKPPANKNILFVNSKNDGYDFFSDLISEVLDRGFKLSFLTLKLSDAIGKIAAENNLNVKKTGLGPALAYYSKANHSSSLNSVLFLCLLPWLYLKFAAKLIYYKLLKKIKIIVCLDINEKIIMSPLAYVFGFKVIWLEGLNLDYKIMPGPIKYLYLTAGKKAAIISFNKATTANLKKIGLELKNIIPIKPGVKLKTYQRQESIFNTIAQKKYEKINYKFFTVGTIIGSKNKNIVDCLFRAAEKTLNTIPNLQIMIMGEAADNKKLNWLARQIGVDNIVWFVGKQKYIKNWLNNFNVFVFSSLEPGFEDIKYLLKAMAAGLPIILPRAAGLEEYLGENKSSLFADIDNSDSLANCLIELKSNALLRKQLGRNARERLIKNYSYENMVNQFIDVLQSPKL